MTRLFKRAAKLTIWRALPDQFFTAQSNALIIEQLRIKFSIEKHLGKEPNKCEVSIYNLAPETRTAVEHKPLQVRLEAGYDGQLHRMFDGDLRYAKSSRNGTEWETKLQVADGDRAYRYGHISQSFVSGVSLFDIGRAIAGTMGLTIDAANLLRLGKVTLVKGYTAHGPARVELTKILKPHGLSWSIQDRQIQILADNEVIHPGQAAVISQDNGMINSPEYGSPPQPGKTPILNIKSLIYPQIEVGGVVDVRSQSVKGQFKVEKLSHTGDTHGSEWTTELEVRTK